MTPTGSVDVTLAVGMDVVCIMVDMTLAHVMHVDVVAQTPLVAKKLLDNPKAASLQLGFAFMSWWIKSGH
jgi:hypothetical protein